MLSLPKDNSNASPVPRLIDDRLERSELIFHLHFGAQVIRATSEHPFYVWGKGWTEAGDMEVGDWCKSEDGQWVMLTDKLNTGELEAVYNFTVEDYHTYYVGRPEWGFSVWAHNEGTCQHHSDPKFMGGDKKCHQAP